MTGKITFPNFVRLVPLPIYAFVCCFFILWDGPEMYAHLEIKQSAAGKS